MHRNSRRIAAAMLAAIALTIPTTSAFATDNAPAKEKDNRSSAQKLAEKQQKENADPTVSVFVQLKNQPSQPSQSAEKANISEQDILIARLKEKYGLQVERQLGYLVNGFAAKVKLSQINSLRNESGIDSVRRERLYYPTQNNANTLEGVSQATREAGLNGQGMVVSIIDTGIDPTHQDMQMSEEDCAQAKIKSYDTSKNFTCKVPYGYNYADKDGNFTDSSPSDQHGMHVAGSVGADGDITGVAPKAQLLAMKVFSNLPDNEGAHDSDIVAAIEDSVKLGADVINMSLGSANGIIDSSEGTSLAIAHAREQGVFVVVSAGNEGLNFSPAGGTDDVQGLWDDGPVGTPATSEGAFAVASVENSILHAHVAQIRESDPEAEDFVDLAFNPATGELDSEPHQLIDAGFGSEEEFEEVTDQFDEANENDSHPYALVQRGGQNEDGETLSFADKFDAAYEAGAEGIVIYNHEAGGDAFIGIGGVGDYAEYPSASLYHSTGHNLAEKIRESNEPIFITFTDEVREFDNPFDGRASDFTSWGPTSDLKFKPQIAGIGGNVYSTQNDNSYTTMSGTSMAAPNISGISALLLQQVRKDYPQFTSAQALDFIEQTMMNTATPVSQEDGVPYGPRRIGAGVANVDRARATKVTATVNGKPYAEPGEVNSDTPFTVTLTNYGQTDATFTIPEQTVLGETNEKDADTSFIRLNNAVIPSAQNVTVPAGGSAEITFTLKAWQGYTGFVEGWLELTSQDDSQPGLAVPYLGFAGDWNREKIVLDPYQMWGKDYNENFTEMRLTYGDGMLGDWGQKNPLYTYRLSPNGDGNFDTMHPALVLMRNAKDIRYSILDSGGNEIKVLGEDHDQNRYTAGLATTMTNDGELDITLIGKDFDGKVWNGQKGEFEVLPDGKYTYRVAARLGDNFDWQYTDFPFEIDTISPTVKIESVTDGVATITMADTDDSIFDDVALAAEDQDGNVLEVNKVDGKPNTFTVSVPEDATRLTVTGRDYGENVGMAVRILEEGKLMLANRDALDGKVVGPRFDLYLDGHIGIHGYTSADITRVDVAGEKATFENGLFMAAYLPTPGENTVSVVGYNDQGEEVARDEVTFIWDATPPVLTLTTPSGTTHVTPDEEGNITVEGTLVDERASSQELTLKIGDEEVPLDENGHFSYTGNPERYYDLPIVIISGNDGANSATEALIIDEEEEEDLDYDIHFNNAECIDAQSMCFVIPGSEAVDGNTFHLEGYVTKGAKRIVFTQSSRFNEDGSLQAHSVEGDIDENDDFTADITFTNGMTPVRVQEFDENGEIISDRVWTFLYDGELPVVHFTTPKVINGKIFTNSTEPLTLAGQAWDNGLGYTLSANDSVITELFYRTSAGEATTKRDFTHEVAVKDGDTLYVMIRDFLGNALAGLVPVVVDTEAPSLNVGVEENARLTPGETITVSAHDASIDSLKVALCSVADPTSCTTLDSAAPKSEGALESTLSDVTALVTGAEKESNGEMTVDRTKLNSALAGRTLPLAADDISAHTTENVSTGENGENVTPPAREDTSVQDLTVTLPTTDLTSGAYRIVATSSDFAGNTSAEARTFTLDAPAEITGPDSLDLTMNESTLKDPQASAAAVLENYSLTDSDGAINSDGSQATGEQKLELAPGTALTSGSQTVTLVGTDAAGRTVSREVTVTITVKAESETPAGGGENHSGGAQPGDGSQSGNQPGTDAHDGQAGAGSDHIGGVGVIDAGKGDLDSGQKATSAGSAPQAHNSDDALAFTGAAGLPLALVSMLMIAVGAGVYRRTRTRQ